MNTITPVISLKKSTPTKTAAREAVQEIIQKFFDKTASRIAKKISALEKGSVPISDKVPEGDRDKWTTDVIEIDWSDLPSSISKQLTVVSQEFGSLGLAQVNMSSDDLINSVNSVAAEWSQQRAAELVGMKWVDGELVENPDAYYAISDTTRDELREIIEESFLAETDIRDVAKQVKEAGAFSSSRADMIAHTEVVRAQGLGNLEAWRQSGVVAEVEVLLSSNHTIDDECDDIVNDGPYAIEEVPEYPFHPRCECTLRASKIIEPVTT